MVLYVASEFRNCRKDPNSIRLIFRSMFSPEGEYPRFNYVEEFKREREMIALFIQKNGSKTHALNPEFISSALMGVMLIQILEYFFTGRPTLSRRTAEKMVDLLMPFSSPVAAKIPIGKVKGGRS